MTDRPVISCCPNYRTAIDSAVSDCSVPDSFAAAVGWLNLHDSAFPAGRLVHSNGIESWLRAFPDAGPDQIVELVVDYVATSVATLDAVVGVHAWASDDLAMLTGLDRELLSYKTSENARDASLKPGRQLADTAARVGMICGVPDCARADYLRAVSSANAPGNLAVVEAVVQAGLGIDRRIATLGTLRSSMASAFSACVRLGRLGSLGAQRALVAATPALVDLAADVERAPLDALSSSSFALELFGMRHAQMSPRLFAS